LKILGFSLGLPLHKELLHIQKKSNGRAAETSNRQTNKLVHDNWKHIKAVVVAKDSLSVIVF